MIRGENATFPWEKRGSVCCLKVILAGLRVTKISTEGGKMWGRNTAGSKKGFGFCARNSAWSWPNAQQQANSETEIGGNRWSSSFRDGVKKTIRIYGFLWSTSWDHGERISDPALIRQDLTLHKIEGENVEKLTAFSKKYEKVENISSNQWQTQRSVNKFLWQTADECLNSARVGDVWKFSNWGCYSW